MTNFFSYEIVPPTNVIEASLTREPDDVSTAYVRINVTNEGADVTVDQVAAIKFRIRYASSTEEDDDILQAALTRNPRSITPVAREFEEWTITGPVQTQEGIAEFTATPDKSVALKEDDTLGFYLYDIEVVDRDGVTKIEVVEEGNPAPVPVELPIRKKYPALRIDYFTASRLSDAAGDTTSGPVELSWETTGATDILLSGTTSDDRNTRGNPKATQDDADKNSYWITEIDPVKGEVAGKDGSFRVNPQTTTTYTLQALRRGDPTRSGEDAPERKLTDFPLAIQQLTVIVTDQTKTPRLVVGDSASRPASTGGIAADTITATASVTTNTVKAKNIQDKSSTEKLTITAETIKAKSIGDKSDTEKLTVTAETLEAKSLTAKSGTGQTLSVTADSITLKTNKISTGESSVSVGDFLIPAGGIIMWSGAEVPDGWTLCDGKNNDETANANIPNLSGRFIVAKGRPATNTGEETVTYDIGQMGGKAKVQLEDGEVASHTHTLERSISISTHKHSSKMHTFVDTGMGSKHNIFERPTETDSATAKDTVELKKEGVNSSHENRPPYYVLAFIMKLPAPSAP